MRRPVSTHRPNVVVMPANAVIQGAAWCGGGEPYAPLVVSLSNHTAGTTRPRDGFLLSQEWLPLIPEAALHRNHPCEACPRGNGEQGSTASYYAAPRIHHRPTVVVMPVNAGIQGAAGVAVSRMLTLMVSLSNHTADTTRPRDGFLLSQGWLPLISEAALHRNHPCEACPRGNGEQGSTATP